MGARGAQCHTHTQFTRPAAREIGHQAVHADGRHEQSHHRNNRQRVGCEAEAEGATATSCGYVQDRRHRLIGIEIGDRDPDGGPEIGRIASRAEHEGEVAGRSLRHRTVDRGRHAVHQPVVGDITDDANRCHQRTLFIEPESLPDRIFSRPHLARERLTDDGHRQAVGAIGLGRRRVPAAQEPAAPRSSREWRFARPHSGRCCRAACLCRTRRRSTHSCSSREAP